MGGVDDHAQLVHLPDQLGAEVGDAAVEALHAPSGHGVLHVVAEPEHPQAELELRLEVLELRAEVGAVLRAHEARAAALRLGAADVGRPQRLHQPREGVELRLRDPEGLQAVPDLTVSGRDAGVLPARPKLVEVASEGGPDRSEEGREVPPLGALVRQGFRRVQQRERAVAARALKEHVNDHALIVQPQRPPFLLGCEPEVEDAEALGRGYQ